MRTKILLEKITQQVRDAANLAEKEALSQEAVRLARKRGMAEMSEKVHLERHVYVEEEFND